MAKTKRLTLDSQFYKGIPPDQIEQGIHAAFDDYRQRAAERQYTIVSGPYAAIQPGLVEGNHLIIVRALIKEN